MDKNIVDSEHPDYIGRVGSSPEDSGSPPTTFPTTCPCLTENGQEHSRFRASRLYRDGREFSRRLGITAHHFSPLHVGILRNMDKNIVCSEHPDYIGRVGSSPEDSGSPPTGSSAEMLGFSFLRTLLESRPSPSSFMAPNNQNPELKPAQTALAILTNHQT